MESSITIESLTKDIEEIRELARQLRRRTHKVSDTIRNLSRIQQLSRKLENAALKVRAKIDLDTPGIVPCPTCAAPTYWVDEND